MSVLMAIQASRAMMDAHQRPRMSTLELALERTKTHDCEFTRGYWMGVIMQMIIQGDRETVIHVPQSMVAGLRIALGKDVSLNFDGTSFVNRFGVRFTPVQLTF